MITSSVVNDIIKTTVEYENNHLGIKNGPDYSALAAVLLDSSEFGDMCKSATIISMFGMAFCSTKANTEKPPLRKCSPTLQCARFWRRFSIWGIVPESGMRRSPSWISNLPASQMKNDRFNKPFLPGQAFAAKLADKERRVKSLAKKMKSGKVFMPTGFASLQSFTGDFMGSQKPAIAIPPQKLATVIPSSSIRFTISLSNGGDLQVIGTATGVTINDKQTKLLKEFETLMDKHEQIMANFR